MPHSRIKPEHSLRYELIQPGVIRYADGREVCLDTPDGWREYKRRVEIMWRRQNFKCSLCKKLALANATFEHQRRRGMGAAWRNDDPNVNGAAHWICNTQRG